MAADLASVLERRARDGEQHGGGGRGRRAPGRGRGVGAAPSVEAACDALVTVTDRDEPDPAWVKAYADAYPLYRELYPALKPITDRLRT